MTLLSCHQDEFVQFSLGMRMRRKVMSPTGHRGIQARPIDSSSARLLHMQIRYEQSAYPAVCRLVFRPTAAYIPDLPFSGVAP